MLRTTPLLRRALAPLVLLLAPVVLPAQERAENAPILLRLPASTRALAMGDAYVAVADADAVHYNPAQLVSGRGITFGVQRYGSAATLGTYASAIAAGGGGLGVGVRYLDYAAPCDACTAALPASAAALSRRGTSRASSLAATVGYARELFGVRIGVAGTVAEQRVGGARDALLAADVGVGYALGPVSVGLAVQNLGGHVALLGEEWELPRRITAGGAFNGLPVGPVDISATAALMHVAGGDVVAGAGLEVGWSWLDGHSVAARLGLRTNTDAGDVPVTAGAAFTRDRVSIEYAYQPFDGVDDAHRVGLRLRLP